MESLHSIGGHSAGKGPVPSDEELPLTTELSVDRILQGLNSAQRSAVTAASPIVQILAPPGSGKTKTLTARTAYLLQHDGYKPWNVICCTFTIKASREMRERIRKLIGRELESKLILGTFHSICRRYLATHGHLIGIEKNFGIADESDSRGILTRIIKRLNFNIEPKTARARISRHKAQGLTSFDISKPTKRVDQQEFVTVFQEYEAALTSSNRLDYDDLLLKCSELLRQHPSCVTTVEAVLVDEFQDTNIVQYDLMGLFAQHKKRITIVGDPDQSIYGFRSAEIANLKRMQTHYADTIVVNLEENYRSSGAILQSADKVIREDTSRLSKELRATHCYGTLPTLRSLPSATVEAEWLVLEIKRAVGMTGNMLNYSDFAVLLRSSSLSRHLESAMGNAGMPYKMVGGRRFYDRYEIKVLLDYMRVTSQLQNSDALSRIINIPSRKIGDTTIKALLEEADTQKTSLWTVIVGATTGNKKPKTKLRKFHEDGLSSFVNLVLNGRKKLEDCNPSDAPYELLKYLIEKLKWYFYLQEYDDLNHEDRIENVKELLAQAQDDRASLESDPNQLPGAEEPDNATLETGEEILSRFLANIALSTEVQQEESSAPQPKVTISTIHAAKGLEWPVVFIPAVYNGSIPHSRAEDQEEERRLLYVAMTRAQSLLYLSCPRRNSEQDDTSLSCFLPPTVVKGLFHNKGPNFTIDVIQSIGRILDRTYPEKAAILSGCTDLRSLEDDVWPLSGKRDPEDLNSQSYEIDEAPIGDSAPKRQKTQSWSQTNRVALQQYPVNFVSAASVNLSTQKMTVSTLRSVNLTQETTGRKSGMGKRSTAGREGKSQSTLTSFFRENSVGESAETAPGAIAVEFNPLPKQMIAVPEAWTGHELQAKANWTRPKPLPKTTNETRYQFLSSPPSKVEREKCGNVSTENQMGHDAVAATKMDTRPATTFHATSIQQVQRQQVTERKTLGIRRTFNGWADRMSKEGHASAKPSSTR